MDRLTEDYKTSLIWFHVQTRSPIYQRSSNLALLSRTVPPSRDAPELPVPANCHQYYDGMKRVTNSQPNQSHSQCGEPADLDRTTKKLLERETPTRIPKNNTSSKVKLFNTRSPASKATRSNIEVRPEDFQSKGRGDFKQENFSSIPSKNSTIVRQLPLSNGTVYGGNRQRGLLEARPGTEDFVIVENQTRLRQELCVTNGVPETARCWDQEQSGPGDHQME